MSQAYYSPVTVNSGQVPSTQTDFPILISYTDARFKTVGNGGHVQNSNGYDIRPYSDSSLSTALTYELERYNASTGEVVMWVKRSSLADGNVTYLGYGDSSLTTDGSSGSGTFSNGFIGVHHVKDGSTLTIANSVQAGTSVTNNNGVTATTGKIDGGAGFASASGQYISAAGMTGAGSSVTFSFWANATSFPTSYVGTISANASGNASGLLIKSNGKLAAYIHTTGGFKSYDGTGSTTLSTSTWYHLAVTYSNANGVIGYVNASQDGTAAGGSNATTFTDYDLGRDIITNTRLWNGALDEMRIASVERSANWITTEYNNQNAPSTFATLGSEVGLSAGTNGWFFFFR